MDPKDPIYFKMETKREYMAATTKNLSEMPTTELVEELRLQGIRRKAMEQQIAMLWRLSNNHAHEAIDAKEEAQAVWLLISQ